VRLGTAAALVATMLREDASDAVVGVILCAVGLGAVLLFLRQRSQVPYLHYGGFAFSMGLWLLCQMGCRNFLVDAPMAWLTVEIFALYAAVAFLLRFVVEIFGRGPLGLARLLSYLLFGFLVLAALLVSTGVVGLVQPLVPFRILLLGSILYTLIMLAVLSAQGNAEARLFAVGFLISALFGVHDTLAVAGVLPRREISFSQFGQAGFVLCLGLILLRRFQRLHQNLEEAEKTLSEKVSQLEERNREVQQLNADLRRQIEARSKDLAASILEASSSFSEIEVQILGAGFVIADLYKVVRLIGQGGMGSVYEVERTTDGRHLAAKVLSVKAGKQVLARFAREAQLLARLKHPNLVTIQDVDMTQSHMAYIVMELVNGHSLAALSASYRNLAFARKVLLQIADALALVHSQGIVHRDLKPENVLILHADDVARLTVKLVDFGVSMILDDKITQQPGESAPVLPAESPWDGQHVAPDSALASTAGDSSALRPVSTSGSASGSVSDTARPSSPLRISSRPAELTQTGIIMGTPLYMAPELRLGAKHARPSSDMFSFGVLAYEIVAGQLPSEQPALLQIFRKDRPWFAPLVTRNPDVPAELAALIERCLDPEIENRPSAAEFRAALQRGV
jgi:serine/threonine-protein kinase